MKKQKATYKQLIEYIDQMNLGIENNQKAVYDLAQIIGDYVEMRGRSKKLNEYMNLKYGLGSDAQIPTRWSVFYNYCKNSYLKLKKKLAFKK